MHISRKKSHSVLYIVMFCCLVLVTAGVGGHWLPHMQPQSDSTQQAQTAKTSSPSPLLAIGSSKIQPLPGDHSDDKSLWRLVNKQNPLNDPQYKPAELTKAPISVRPGLRDDEQSLRTVVVSDLQALVRQASKDGATLLLGSGYRSPELQQFFFDNYAARDGVEAANRYSALPGQSEHQTGLALDFTAGNMSCYLEQCFAETPEGIWLASHAHLYGFILRYTKDSETTTGYQFEPWHYRYVGKELAQALYDNSMLLETVWPTLLTHNK